jgi:hypothetical protein
MRKLKAVAERLTQTARSNQIQQYVQHEHKGMVGLAAKKISGSRLKKYRRPNAKRNCFPNGRRAEGSCNRNVVPGPARACENAGKMLGFAARPLRR